MKAIALALLTLSLTASGWAKDITFKELLGGNVAPLSLHLKSLDGSWRRLSVSGANGDGAGALGATYALLLGMNGSRNAYYTKGETLAVEGELFLVAYRINSPPVDLQAIIRGGGMGGRNPPPAPAKPTPETELSLALLHVRTIGTLTDVQPFNLETELAGGDSSPAAREEARDRAAEADNLEHLREAGKAVLLYAQDGDKSLPPLESTAAAAKALQPYAKDKAIFANLTPNAALSGRRLADVTNPNTTIVFYETKTGANGRGVVFLDAHTERVSEARWPELQKAGRLP